MCSDNPKLSEPPHTTLVVRTGRCLNLLIFTPFVRFVIKRIDMQKPSCRFRICKSFFVVPRTRCKPSPFVIAFRYGTVKFGRFENSCRFFRVYFHRLIKRPFGMKQPKSVMHGRKIIPDRFFRQAAGIPKLFPTICGVIRIVQRRRFALRRVS